MKTTVLLVDDNETYRYAIACIMKDAGYSVVEVKNLKEAKERLATMKFDWVVSDYHLPDGLGTDLLKEVAENHSGTNRILMSSGREPRGNPDRFHHKFADTRMLLVMIEGFTEAVPQ